MKLIPRTDPRSLVAATSQLPAGDSVDACPYVVRRGGQIIAAFAQKSDAGNWARDYSNLRDMQSTFYVHTAAEILCAYRDGNEVEAP